MSRPLFFFKNLPFLFKAGLIFIVLGLLGWMLFRFLNPFCNPKVTESVKTVEVITVKPQEIKQTARLIGTVKPKQSTILLAKSSGVFRPLLRSGKQATRGELIAKIDNEDGEKNYLLCESAAKIAHNQYDRETNLFHAGHSSKHSVETKKNLWIEAQKNLAAAKSALEKVRFYAPFDGVLGVFKAGEGSQVQEGDPIVSFYDPSEIRVDFDIPAPLIAFIHIGQPLYIQGKEYSLTHFQSMVDETTQMCPASVKVALEGSIIGTAIDLDLVLQKKENALVIPSEAVFLRDGKPFVYKVIDKKAALTPVEVGIREKDQVEITTGLQPGDVIIFTGQSRLHPGVSVHIHKEG